MHRVLAIVLIALALVSTTVVGQTPSAEDEAGVRAALQHYLNGHATGSERHFTLTLA